MALSSVTTLGVSNGRHNGNGQAGQSNGAVLSVKIVVNGHILDLATIAQMKPAARAILSADLRKAGLPAWKAQLLTGGPSPGYVSTASHLTEQQRESIDRGERSLSDFHNAKKLDREIEAYIRRKTRKEPSRVLMVLDRIIDHMTAPTKVMPAE